MNQSCPQRTLRMPSEDKTHASSPSPATEDSLRLNYRFSSIGFSIGKTQKTILPFKTLQTS